VDEPVTTPEHAVDDVDPDLPPMQVTRRLADVLVVSWDDVNREWEVSARASGTDQWSVLEGAEDELDTLLSIARDVVTGG
jgi:hypothetical protein